jgi:hypothetical protein
VLIVRGIFERSPQGRQPSSLAHSKAGLARSMRLVLASEAYARVAKILGKVPGSSPARNPMGPIDSESKVPAFACTNTLHADAHSGEAPRARSAVSRPASVSPEPAVASPHTPPEWRQISPSAVAI